MKKCLLQAGLFLTSITTFAQSNILGNGVDYFNSFQSTIKRTASTDLAIGNNKYNVKIHTSTEENVIGVLDQKGSFLLLSKKGNQVTGQLVISETDSIAYEYTTNPNGDLVITKVDIDKVLCVSYGGNENTSNQTEARLSNLQAAPRGTLQSLPGCPYVIMIDFDGYNLPAGTPWNSGASRIINGVTYTEAEEETIWNNIKEDYSPFQVNITTSEAVYAAAATTKRMKVVITRDEVTPGGGVAIINSFGKESVKNCWVYPNKLGESLLSVAEASSHEAGHTLGLQHDGAPSTPDYYDGHNGWAPIMGNSYRSFVTQWSKGEYTGANNKQDDLASITGYLPYKTDDHGNTNALATEIKYVLDNAGTAQVSAASNAGIIERNTDVDVFHFYLSGGQINLLFKPTGTPRTNLDIQVSLFDKSGTLIQKYNTTHSAGSSTVATSVINGFTITKSLPKGDYYLEIDGVGSGSPITGWSDYNSMGQYAISGTIVGIEQKSYDIGLDAINNIYSMNCGNEITPSLKIINSGKMDLTSFSYEVFIDNVSKGVKSINAVIVSGLSKDIALPVIPITTFGNKTLKIVVSLPNGNPDEIPVNNELTKTFNIGDGSLYQFSISSLSREKTLTWKITSNGTAITDNTKVTDTKVGGNDVSGFCLANDKCFSFEILKAFKENTCAVYAAWNSATQYKAGDIVVYQGNVYKANTDIWTVDPTTAWYSLIGPCPVVNTNDLFVLKSMNDSIVVASVKYSDYKSPYKIDFCNNKVTALELENTLIGVYPNPIIDDLNINTEQSILSVSIYNLQSELILTRYGISTIQLGNLTSGVYLVKIETKEGVFNKLIYKQ